MREPLTGEPVRPFRIEVADGVLEDLRSRLARTRWPEAECVDDWSQGMPLAYTRELADYWANEYDWRSREAALNRFDQFITEIDGLDIHFIHQRSPHEDAFPLLITHGWPGSIVEFHKVIEPLTDPTAHGAAPRTLFTSCARRFPGTGSPASPPAPAGASKGSPGPGRRSCCASVTTATARRAATGVRPSRPRSAETATIARPSI